MNRSNVAYFLLCLTLIGCGKDNASLSVAPELEGINREVMSLMAESGFDLSTANITNIIVGETPDNTLGVYSSEGTITINVNHFNQQSNSSVTFIGSDGNEYPSGLAYTLGHEWGHALGLGHVVSGTNSNGNLMNQYSNASQLVAITKTLRRSAISVFMGIAAGTKSLDNLNAIKSASLYSAMIAPGSDDLQGQEDIMYADELQVMDHCDHEAHE